MKKGFKKMKTKKKITGKDIKNIIKNLHKDIEKEKGLTFAENDAATLEDWLNDLIELILSKEE